MNKQVCFSKNKQIIRILILSLIIAGLGLYAKSLGLRLGTRAHQIGDLLFTWPGSTTHDSIFTEGDFKPGDCVTKPVNVENQGTSNAIIGVYSDDETDTDTLLQVLTIEITEGLNSLYGPETLATFASDSDVLNEIELSNLAGGGQTTYNFTICFPENEGNEHQGDAVSFDLKFGQIPPPVELPAVCDDLEGIVTEIIDGTPGDDEIDGTSASEFISGFEGNDEIDGGGGHDCIIGGPGEEDIDGGSGNDIIDGGTENDDIDGGSGNDLIYSNGGDDKINAGSGNDEVYGGEGADKIEGSSDNDYIEGGSGNDKIGGGSGNDELFGQDGDDNISGGSGNDLLDGGANTDTLNGNSGTDDCDDGETLSACEL